MLWSSNPIDPYLEIIFLHAPVAPSSVRISLEPLLDHNISIHIENPQAHLDPSYSINLAFLFAPSSHKTLLQLVLIPQSFPSCLHCPLQLPLPYFGCILAVMLVHLLHLSLKLLLKLFATPSVSTHFPITFMTILCILDQSKILLTWYILVTNPLVFKLLLPILFGSKPW
jgi:hypothetical protein